MSDLQQLEAETLEAALSFLDEFEPHEDPLDGLLDTVELHTVVESTETAAALREANATSTGVSTEAPTSTISPSQPKRRTRHRTNDFNPNRARDERRNELVHLRSQVRAMEAQLQVLKGEQGSDNQPAAVVAALKATAGALMKPHSSSSSSVSSGECSAASVWEEIASHQYAERHKAELENVRLRLALQGQIKLANSLKAILMKRSSNVQVQSYPLAGFLCYIFDRTASIDLSIVREQLHNQATPSHQHRRRCRDFPRAHGRRGPSSYGRGLGL